MWIFQDILLMEKLEELRMANTNIVVLTGRCVRPAELKYTNNGMAICNFSIAVNERTKQGDEYADRPNYFDVTIYGNYGKTMQQYLTKGREVTVTGRLHQDRWESDNEKHSRVSVILENLELQREPKSNSEQPPNNYSPALSYQPPETTDEIPF